MTEDQKRQGQGRRGQTRRGERGYGVLLMIGIFSGLAVGLLLGQPSAGTVIGLGLAGLAVLGLRLAGR